MGDYRDILARRYPKPHLIEYRTNFCKKILLKFLEISVSVEFSPQELKKRRSAWLFRNSVRKNNIGVKPVQEEKFVEIPTPIFFPVFIRNLGESVAGKPT